MGILIEQQAVIDCLTNTAKYYDMPQADEWTKGIHYGLLHGIDNILDNVKPVEAIPKADYENRLKADMVAMLEDLRFQAEENIENIYEKDEDNILMLAQHNAFADCFAQYNSLIEERIDALKGRK